MTHELHIPARIRDIVREADWYDHVGSLKASLTLGSVATCTLVAPRADEQRQIKASRLLQHIFAQLLGENAVALGEAGPNWDQDRQPIDTVVVHHTSSAPPMSLPRLNAMHLLNLYVPKYHNPGEDLEAIGGTPIYSGHADKAGKQVFYGYHWLIRSDGSREQLLPDEAIGWHAGDWSVNVRSVAICFDGDFEQGRPSQQALDAAAGLIAQRYSRVPSARVFGHREIVQTVCPGGEFGVWGEELKALVEANQLAT